MLISIVNFTRGKKQVDDHTLLCVVRAINRQINEDFAPYWGMSASLRVEGRSVAAADDATLDDLRGDAILYLATSVSQTDGVLGFHDRNARGIPFGFVFTDLSDGMEESWSVTLSHEALELIADPEANLLVMGPHPNEKEDRVVFHWFEMCDAVQTQTYKIDGVVVSNFVLPLYFTGTRDVDEVGARNNFLNTKLKSFGLSAGGYVGFYDPELGNHTQVFGAKGEARAAVKAQAEETRRSLRYRSYDDRFKRIARPAATAVGRPVGRLSLREQAHRDAAVSAAAPAVKERRQRPRRPRAE
jgi:hypothetical protein